MTLPYTIYSIICKYYEVFSRCGILPFPFSLEGLLCNEYISKQKFIQYLLGFYSILFEISVWSHLYPYFSSPEGGHSLAKKSCMPHFNLKTQVFDSQCSPRALGNHHLVLAGFLQIPSWWRGLWAPEPGVVWV